MNLPLSSGKKGETPILLDPVDQAIPNVCHSPRYFDRLDMAASKRKIKSRSKVNK
jgi:hypothetical protein